MTAEVLTAAQKKSLSYELGVLMFQLVSPEGIISLGNYDAVENFKAIYTNAEPLVEEVSFKEGFFAEAENEEISKEKAEVLYRDCMVTLETY